MTKPQPGSSEMFAKRMRPGKRKRVQKEFNEFIKDLGYESLLGSTAMKAYLYEFFVGGWGAKTKQMKMSKKLMAK